jgi:hypothetical protein
MNAATDAGTPAGERAMGNFEHLPPMLIVRALWLRLRGKVHFPRDRTGEIVTGDVEDYRVFRQMVVDPTAEEATPPGAVLDVRFRFKRFSPAANRQLSRLPMPFIAVQPGFRSKTWMVGERSGTFRGLYEWATAEDAECYLDSFPMRMMRRRAVERTLETSIASTDPSGATSWNHSR